jgi:uncharacterized protein (TIGR03067 family)
MKPARSIAAMLSVLIATLSASAMMAQEPAGGDLAKLQGKWTAFLKTTRGTTRIVLEFKDNLVYTTMGRGPSDKPDTVMEVVLDESTTPRQMLFHNGKNVGAEPGSMKDKVRPPDSKLIYELKDDTLTTCADVASNKLPTKFASGGSLILSTYKRGEIEGEEMTSKTKTKSKTKTTAKPSKPAAVVEGDLALLQGSWKSQAHGLNAEHETMTIQGDAVLAVAKVGKAEIRFQSRIRIDETASPKAIDFLDSTVGSKTLPPSMGIYAFDGDTLKIHRSGLRRARASVFQDGAEQGVVSIWTRPGARRPPAAKPAAASDSNKKPLKRAVVGKATKEYYQLFIDGEELRIYADEPHAMSFDASGKELERKSATKLLHEGNVVEVDFFSKHPVHPYYMLSEIHLIEGEIR